jgi:hypothetical protein
MKYSQQVRADREAWRANTPDVCMYCGVSGIYGLEVHEIDRKSHARNRWGVRCNYLKLCRTCHANAFASMPHDRQLAVKLICDVDNFDLEEWLRIRDPELRAPDRVTMTDIVQHLRVV